MTKITVHRALAELKTVEKRINKKITNIRAIDGYQKGKLVANLYSVEDYTKTAKAELQSTIDLINRTQLLKTKIAESNTITKVNIGGKEYTVSEAINFRAIVEHKRTLINTLRNQFKSVTAELNRVNEKVENNSIIIAQNALGREGVKITDEDAMNIITPYMEANQWHICNPLDIEKWCNEKEEELDTFDTEVDAVLSESNSITTIDVD